MFFLSFSHFIEFILMQNDFRIKWYFLSFLCKMTTELSDTFQLLNWICKAVSVVMIFYRYLYFHTKFLMVGLSQSFDVAFIQYSDGLVQERRNSIAIALELHLSCTDPSIRNRLITTNWWCYQNDWPIVSIPLFSNEDILCGIDTYHVYMGFMQ